MFVVCSAGVTDMPAASCEKRTQEEQPTPPPRAVPAWRLRELYALRQRCRRRSGGKIKRLSRWQGDATAHSADMRARQPVPATRAASSRVGTREEVPQQMYSACLGYGRAKVVAGEERTRRHDAENRMALFYGAAPVRA